MGDSVHGPRFRRGDERTQDLDIACEHFKDVGRGIQRWLKQQPAVGEESITDWMLYQLSERVPGVFYRKFTRHEEAREFGADWEWWFVGFTRSFGMRVQAKKLKKREDNYRGIAHTNSMGLQIELLLEAAQADNLMPLYAFYYGSDSRPDLLCPHMHGTDVDEGAFVARARTIHQEFIVPGRSRVLAESILEHSNPLSCLACCLPIRLDDEDPVHGIINYFLKYQPLPEYPDSDFAGPRSIPGEHKKPPGYVDSLLEIGNGPLPRWWEHEFGSQIGHTKAMLLCDLRDQLSAGNQSG